jgi:molybdopterin-biosynthesis enzyme MoeA-like protein
MQKVHIEQFGLILIGDEILFGRRQDSHFNHFRQLLSSRGLRLSRCWLLPDEADSLTAHLRFSLQSDLPVFVCGGIGATPDDLTRPCAAEAVGVPLERHPEAAALIEERFGEAAYPTRIRMADLPAGCELIPNPHNRIPGFSIRRHHFLPGFPEMAWPMAEWVLETLYVARHSAIQEVSLWITDTPESTLVPLMEAFEGRFPGLKLYSLPRLGKPPRIELGLRGRGDIDAALTALRQELKKADIPFQQNSGKD